MNSISIVKILSPWLGTDILEQTALPEKIAEEIRQFSISRDDLFDLFSRLDSMIFCEVSEFTDGRMIVQLDDGKRIHLYLEDIAEMADELLYPMMSKLPNTSESCNRLKQYAMTHTSLSALHALYVDFSSFQSDEEKKFISRLVKEEYRPYRWKNWLV